MHEGLFKTGKALTIVILFVLLSAYGIKSIDPYKYAEKKMTEVINSNQGFVNNLSVYGNEAKGWRDSIQIEVTFAKGILSAFNTIKSLGAWDIFLRLVDKIPEGRLLILGIERLATTILELDRVLSEVSLAIDKSAGFSHLAEQGYLSKDEIREICEHNAELKDGLIKAKNAMDVSSGIVREVIRNPQLSNFKSSMEGLRASQVIGVSSLADVIYQALDAWQDLPGILDQISNRINGDLETIDQVSSWYTQAETWDQALEIIPLRPMANWVIDWRNFFVLVLTMSTGCAFIGYVGPSTIFKIQWPVLAKRQTNIPYIQRKSYRQVSVASKSKSVANTPVRNNLNSPNRDSIPSISREKVELSLLCNWRYGKQENLALPCTGKVTIGSGQMDDIRTHPIKTASFQAFIKKARVNFYIQVLDTRFPTRINGRLIKCAHVLKPGDNISMGDLMATVKSGDR